jgi:hypothetical protein
MQKREHRPRSCDDSVRRCDSQAGWDFRKGQQAIAVRELDPTAHLALKHNQLTPKRGILSLETG